jgi:SNF2 family DNA or RNA helicase
VIGITRISVLSDSHILVRSPYELKDVIKSIPGAQWDRQRLAWRFPATPASALNIHKALQDNGGYVADVAFRGMVSAAVLTAVKTAEVRRAEDIPETVEGVKTRLWRHQAKAVAFVRALWDAGNPAGYLALDMGCGKSLCVVSLICHYRLPKTLIVCPKSVIDAWPKQFELHAAVPVRVVTLGDDAGSVANKLRRAQEALAKISGPIVLCINYESVWREPFGSWALSVPWDLLVCDEIHRAKAPGGRAAKYLANLGKRAKYRLGLSGTPMPHSPLDIYAQMKILAPEIFGTSFTSFKARYAIMGGFQGYEVVGYRHLDELQEKFGSIAFRVTKDVLELPEVQHLTRYCDLAPGARRLYYQLQKELVAEVEQGTVTAANALTKLLRLQQITSGAVTDDDGRTIEVPSGKAELLADVMEDLDPKEPLVVFARFVHDLDVIRDTAKAQGRTVAELSGRTNDLKLWQDGGADVLAVQIQAGGVGIDLTRARYAIYYSLGFSLGDYEQSLARIHRPGQTRPVTYIHLLCRDTVDEKVYRALAERKEVVEAVLEDLAPKNLNLRILKLRMKEDAIYGGRAVNR